MGGGELLSPAELDAAKAYLRIEGDEEDQAVTAAVLAAREYLSGAGVSLPSTGGSRRALYDLVCHSLALSTYDRRDPVITGTIVDENPVLRRMLNQLKLTEPAVSNLDTNHGEGGKPDGG